MTKFFCIVTDSGKYVRQSDSLDNFELTNHIEQCDKWDDKTNAMGVRSICSNNFPDESFNIRPIITLSEYNKLHTDFRSVWTTERFDLPNWEQDRVNYIGKRTLLTNDEGTVLLVEGLGFHIIDDTIEHKIVPVIILDYTSGTAIVVEADVLLEDEDMIEAINTKYGYSLRLKDIDWMELLDRAIYLQTTINIK